MGIEHEGAKGLHVPLLKQLSPLEHALVLSDRVDGALRFRLVEAVTVEYPLCGRDVAQVRYGMPQHLREVNGCILAGLSADCICPIDKCVLGVGLHHHKRHGRAEVDGFERAGAEIALHEPAGLAEQFAAEGKTPLFFAKNGELAGTIAVADEVKETSAGAIAALRSLGVDVRMLTGDNRVTAEAIARRVGLTSEQVIADVLPADKERHVRELQDAGSKVAMVGDGINDSPALARADVGLAIGTGADIAKEGADVVLMRSDLMDVARAIELSRATIRNIKQDLFWALFYNGIGIPLAAGVFFPLTGWQLSPMFGAAAMSLSSVCVVSNALRLRTFKPSVAVK